MQRYTCIFASTVTHEKLKNVILFQGKKEDSILLHELESLVSQITFPFLLRKSMKNLKELNKNR